MSIDTKPRPRTIGQVVADMRRTYPDVSVSSLRYLEREGLIDPIRTPGGHRLFRSSDIDRVRQIKEWQSQRMSLADIRDLLAKSDALASPTRLAQEFLAHALQGDLAAATRSILTADELGVPIGKLFAEVLTPTLYEVGERWSAGTLSVGQEHEISELARDLIAELTLRHARSDSDQPIILAASVAGERHDLGLRMMAGLLRMRGLDVHVLGADVASRFLVESVELRRPALVLLSATLPSRLDQVRATINELRARDVRTRVIAGGQGCYAYPETLRALGADVPIADCLEDLIDQIVALTDAGTSPV